MTGFQFPVGAMMGFFATASRPVLGPIYPPIIWLPEALTLWVKRPIREVGCLPASSTEAKNVWIYTSTPPISLRQVVLS